MGHSGSSSLPAASLQGRIPVGKREPDERGGDVSKADEKQDVMTTHLQPQNSRG